MPEPFSNIAVSLTEDGLVATVVGFSVNHPLTAFAIAATLLLAGLIVLILLYRRLLAAIRRMREKGRGSPEALVSRPTRLQRRDS